jgi:hypothetical protein
MDYCVVGKEHKFCKFLDITRIPTLELGSVYGFMNDMEMKTLGEAKIKEIPYTTKLKALYVSHIQG